MKISRLLILIQLLLFPSFSYGQENIANSSASISSSSEYALRIGVIQTAPGLIVTNTDKESNGHIQSEADYSLAIGLFSPPDPDSFINYFIIADYYTFKMDRQVVGSSENPMDLGTEVDGTVLQIMPGISFTLHFLDNYYISYGIGYGIRNVFLVGDIYLTEGTVPADCQAAINVDNISAVKQSCERHPFNQRVMTTSFINVIDLKIDNFIIRYTASSTYSNSSGDTEDSREKQSIDEHEYQLSVQTLSINYIVDF